MLSDVPKPPRTRGIENESPTAPPGSNSPTETETEPTVPHADPLRNDDDQDSDQVRSSLWRPVCVAQAAQAISQAKQDLLL